MSANGILTIPPADSELGAAAVLYCGNSPNPKFSTKPPSSHQSAHNMFIEYRLYPRGGEFHACDSCTRVPMGR